MENVIIAQAVIVININIFEIDIINTYNIY